MSKILRNRVLDETVGMPYGNFYSFLKSRNNPCSGWQFVHPTLFQMRNREKPMLFRLLSPGK